MSAENLQLSSQQRKRLPRKYSKNTPIARQLLSSRHVIAAIDTHITTEELMEELFSVRSVQSIYNEGRSGSHIFQTIGPQMEVRLSVLSVGEALPPRRFLVLLSVRG
jgi:hypothetical protein